MKKILILILSLVMALGLVGCGNDTAEENEVLSYLADYNWYYEAGGYYDMVYVYQFNRDGTYTSVTYATLPTLNKRFEGTFKINTSKDTIKFKTKDGNKKGYTMTYSLYSDNMKLYSDTKQYNRTERFELE